jgi:hypothetical protein
MSRESTALAVVETPPSTIATRLQNQPIQVIDPIPILDTGRFEHMQRIAQAMAGGTLLPDHLIGYKDGSKFVAYTMEERTANCFLIVNQAVRWNQDPFALAPCTSVIAGKLCFEGKVIAAVLSGCLGIDLEYEWNDKEGDDFGIVVTGRDRKTGEVLKTSNNTPKAVQGTVGDWKTTRDGSPWKNTSRASRMKMLAYRGSREWPRIWAPAIMLGVYTDDEMQHLENHEVRSSRARDVTAVASIAPPAKSGRPNPDAQPETKPERTLDGRPTKPLTPQQEEQFERDEQEGREQSMETVDGRPVKRPLRPNPDEGQQQQATTTQLNWAEEGHKARHRNLARGDVPKELQHIGKVKHRGLWQAGWDQADREIAEDAAKTKGEGEQSQEGQKPLDVEALRSEFMNALHEARSKDNCDEAWHDFIEPVKLQLPDSDFRDIQRMFNNTKKQFG